MPFKSAMTALRPSRFLHLPDLPGRYYRALLFGGGAAVSITILSAAAVAIQHTFEHWIDHHRQVFLLHREHVKSDVDRYQARLQQTVEGYETLWTLLEHDVVPVEEYRKQLVQKNHVVVTGQDMTATPFSLLSTLTHPKDEPRLAMLLRLMREISPAPILRKRDTGYFMGGFMFTEDHRFLATWPPFSERLMDRTRTQGVDTLIESYVERVQAELERHPPDPTLQQRIFWVPLYRSSVTGELITHYVMPIYHDGQRIALMVATIPFSKFPVVFQGKAHAPGFFVISRDRMHLFGIDEKKPQDMCWMRMVRAMPEHLRDVDSNVRFVRQGTTLFIMQSIPGPDWVATYALDLMSVFSDQRTPLLWITGVLSTALLILWLFIFILDRKIFLPLRAHARQVFESEAFNRIVLTTAPVGLTVFDPASGNIVMQNDIASALLATADDEAGFYRTLLGKHAPHVEARPQDVLTGEASLTSDDGQKHEISAAFSWTRYQQQEVVLFGLTDISRQKATIQLLQEARLAADEANQAKSIFVASMSHEIRTPLHGALGNLELLAMDSLTPSQQNRVTTIRQAFDALLAQINDVLDVTKIEAHELQLHREPFSLREMIERCAQTFTPGIVGKGLRYLCLVDPRLSGTWTGDVHRITQVLMNLLGNARKFTQSGVIVLRAMPIQSVDGQPMVRLSVADTGIGIPEDRQQHIFEPFTQVDSSVASRFGGTGLGLSLCKRLTELMGGQLTVESVEGEGSLFTLDLPLERAQMQDACVSHLSIPELDTIVLVCDSPSWQDTLVAQLHQWLPDIEVVRAESSTVLAFGAKRTIILFGGHEDALPDSWSQAVRSCKDAIVLSAAGPLYPERRGETIHVTSLSGDMLKLALSAYGQREDTVLQSETLTPLQNKPVNGEARILIVEDEPLNRALLEQQLVQLGYNQIDSTTNGLEAIRHCTNRSCDVIVTDLGMPLLGGRELLSALRERGISTPVIAHTAGTEKDIEGFSCILHKPVSIHSLRRTLENVLSIQTPNIDAEKPVRPQTISLIHMQSVFLQSWAKDRAALQDAATAGDTARFLRSLHRVKGALLVLSEQTAIDCSEILRKAVEHGGVSSAQGELCDFWKAMTRLELGYR
ncbi:ATP-binding protein [Pseudomonas chlororaphis]|uniref:ATP-binding protein n=1 Tax=Pseudomonas chlororaphis TaxID=587753 RepID=UPI00236858E1|nr:ATP-binding protein [Pseudomonas chlororaphis]WDG77621.1 ATP-binding protein [Pseudomonas chlororaphis]WDG83142.1 ATP-binding protein [Pseudomonas chlororaphis]